MRGSGHYEAYRTQADDLHAVYIAYADFCLALIAQTRTSLARLPGAYRPHPVEELPSPSSSVSHLDAVNCCSVRGTPPLAANVTETATATVTLVTRDKAGVEIHQVLVDSDTIRGETAGDTVDYTVSITNEGTTTLSAFAVSSSLLGDEFECAPVVDLLPGDTVNCTATAEVSR